MKALLSKISHGGVALLVGAALLFGQAMPASAAVTTCAGSTKYIQGSVITCSDPLQTGMSFNYAHFKTDPQAVTQAGATTVHTVTVNTKGASNSHVAIWDAAAWAINGAGNGITGGTLVADIDTNAATGTFTLDTTLTNGLVITCLTSIGTTSCGGTNTVAGEPDVTVSYR